MCLLEISFPNFPFSINCLLCAIDKMASPRASVSHATLTRLKDFSCPGNSEIRVSDQGIKMEVEPSNAGKAERSATLQDKTIMKNSSSELVEEEPTKIKQVWFYKQHLYVSELPIERGLCLNFFNWRLHNYQLLVLSRNKNANAQVITLS